MYPNNPGLVLEKPVAPPTRVFYVLDITPTHEFLWEIDGYCIKDGKTGRDLWTLHVECPKCRRNLTIECTKKALEIGPDTLSIEPFACTWHGDFGQLTCGFKAAIEPPKANQKMTVDHNGVKRRVDGVFRRD
jgi:hypothetical protein